MTNEERATGALRMLSIYMEQAPEPLGARLLLSTDAPEVIADAIVDLHHLADAFSIRWSQVLAICDRNYATDNAEERR